MTDRTAHRQAAGIVIDVEPFRDDPFAQARRRVRSQRIEGTSMTVTVLDCAQAVKAIYKNTEVYRYQLVRGRYDPKNSAVGTEGYSIGHYCGTGAIAGHSLVSVRGSAKGLTTKDWIDDDVSIGVGRTPDRYTEALAFMRSLQRMLPREHFIIVGHSLGGHIAQMVGVMCNLPFITFNAPPALGTWTGRLPNGVDPRNFAMGLNYRVNYDPVSKISGKHVGPLVTLRLAGKPHLKAHGAATVINSVREEGLSMMPALRAIANANNLPFLHN